jgi:MYXO-CTERM domain-containing protein
LGDSGSGDLNQLAVRDSMGRFVGSNKPDILLHMGDIAYSSGTDLEFQFRHFAVYQDTLRNTVMWPTMGNHEGVSSNSATESGPYYDAFALPRRAEAGGLASGTEAYYSFDYANVHFVVLDSHETSRSPTGAMLRWMRDDLAATDQDWIIAFWHHPPYTKGSHDSDAETQLIEMRENALPILEAAGVDLVLAGHSHIYERSYLVNGAYDTPTTSAGRIVDSRSGQNDGGGPYIKNFGQNANEGAVYVVAGHGGASLGRHGTHPLMYFTERRFGSCLMTVDGLEVSIVNVRSDGVVTDHFAMRKREPDGGIGVVDAGVADAGVMDAGVPDGGAPDAGARDAGVTDAGSNDAGTRDAGLLDAGTLVDAGVANEDGGTDPADAGNSDVDASVAARSSGGCGCSSGGGSADLSVALALAALWLWGKRTMRRRREKKE